MLDSKSPLSATLAEPLAPGRAEPPNGGKPAAARRAGQPGSGPGPVLGTVAARSRAALDPALASWLAHWKSGARAATSRAPLPASAAAPLPASATLLLPMPRVSEERLNALSHALAAVLALGAVPLLSALDRPAGGSLAQRLGLALFVLAMAMTYAVSAAYHAWPVGPVKRRLRRWDHALIFVFIAASATPYFLLPVPPGGRQAAQLVGLGLTWVAAGCGLLLKLQGRLCGPGRSTAAYLALGWLVAPAVWSALPGLRPEVWAWLLAGGACYTLGCGWFWLGQRRRFAHLAWHLMASAGSAAHLVAVWLALRPPA